MKWWETMVEKEKMFPQAFSVGIVITPGYLVKDKGYEYPLLICYL